MTSALTRRYSPGVMIRGMNLNTVLEVTSTSSMVVTRYDIVSGVHGTSWYRDTTVKLYEYFCIIMLETLDKSMFHVLHSSTSVLDSAIRKKNQTVYGWSYSSLDTGNVTRTVGRFSKTSVIASANLK